MNNWTSDILLEAATHTKVCSCGAAFVGALHRIVCRSCAYVHEMQPLLDELVHYRALAVHLGADKESMWCAEGRDLIGLDPKFIADYLDDFVASDAPCPLCGAESEDGNQCDRCQQGN